MDDNDRRGCIAARKLIMIALLATSAACGGDDDDRQGSPTSPTPTGRAAVITIENFVATASAPSAAGVVTYTVSLTLRETAGVAATLSGITLTLTTTSGATHSRDYSATEAFGTNRIAASDTLPSMNVSLTGPPLMASSLSARVTFTDDNGNAGTAQATTLVRSA